MAQKEALSVGQLLVRSISAPTESTGTVTQTDNRTTAVTLNAHQGSIVTDATSLATGAEAAFTVTNDKVKVDSIVLVSLRVKSATGTSLPYVSTTADGSFQITLTNLHASTADTSASTINFFVINGKP